MFLLRSMSLTERGELCRGNYNSSDDVIFILHTFLTLNAEQNQ